MLDRILRTGRGRGVTALQGGSAAVGGAEPFQGSYAGGGARVVGRRRGLGAVLEVVTLPGTAGASNSRWFELAHVVSDRFQALHDCGELFG